MNKPVLVDSSIWIEATRKGGDPDVAAKLGKLLASGQVAMAWPVWTELYQGIRGNKEEARLASSRELCSWLEFDDACWEQTAAAARACLRAGANVPFGDILVFACAQRHGVELLEHDCHFDMIRRAVNTS